MARVDRNFDLQGMHEMVSERANLQAPVPYNAFFHEARRGVLVGRRKSSSSYMHHAIDEVLETDVKGREPERRVRRDRLARRALKLVFASGSEGKASIRERARDILERDETNYADWEETDAGSGIEKVAKVSLKHDIGDFLKPRGAEFHELGDPAFGNLFENNGRPLVELARHLTGISRPDAQVSFVSGLKMEDAHRPNPQVVVNWESFSQSGYSRISLTNEGIRRFLAEYSGQKMPVIPIARVENVLGETQLEVGYRPKNKGQFEPVVSERNILAGGKYKGIRAPEGQLELTWSGEYEAVDYKHIARTIFASRGLENVFPLVRLSNREIRDRKRELELERARRAMELVRSIFHK